MRGTTLLVIGLASLLFSIEASSEEFTILEGELLDAASGEAQALTGRLEIRLDDEGFEDVYYVDDFELETDSETFVPSLPIEYDGQQALLLQIANQIRASGDGFSSVYLRSGGHLVGAEGDEVTFRFFDFRGSWLPTAGTPLPIPLSRLDPSRRPGSAPTAEFEGVDVPRRFDLQGTLEQVDQRFRIVDRNCPEHAPVLLPPLDVVIVAPEPVRPFPRDGAVIISQDSARTVLAGGGFRWDRQAANLTVAPTLENLQIAAPQPVRPFPPSGAVIISQDSARTVLGGAGVSWNRQAVNRTVAPTLEDLQITAPQGAEISLSEDGSLSIYTAGDLYLDGPIPELEGVERLDITAEGAIIIAATFEPPEAANLELNSGTNDDPLFLNPVPCGLFPGLRPILPAETLEVGSFSMIASAAPEAVEIELLSRRKPYRLQPRSRKPVWLALLGSETLDVSEVDRNSLRLGPAGGEPVHRFGGPLVFPWDWNRDGHRDLLTVFLSRDLGVGHGDDELCLQAETEQGQRLVGCDEVETLRGNSRRRHRDRDRRERRHRD